MGCCRLEADPNRGSGTPSSAKASITSDSGRPSNALSPLERTSGSSKGSILRPCGRISPSRIASAPFFVLEKSAVSTDTPFASRTESRLPYFYQFACFSVIHRSLPICVEGR